ncbi:MAG TPA: polysaccharide biosynthesis/export family protein [Mucilaginibacter sp.]|nr:polysaccharide biosynthesis/export family protein [Mucilaginibacter sp.]
MKKNIFQNIFLFLSLLTFLTSCVDQKQIAYFQKGINQSDTIAVAKAFVPKIQPGDILAVPIGSLNPLASSFFNPFSTTPVTNDNSPNGTAAAAGSSATAPSLVQSTAPGLLVDAAGNIELPLIGSVQVVGLTTTEAKELIKNKLKVYLKEPTVNVRFLNYKISVLGEVLHPSVYVIPNESITLPEALGLAGDMTIYGKRDNVLIIRDENGKKEFGRVDLTTRDVYTSPFYYLHANDVVYVEPSKGRIAQSDKTYQILPIVLSALSFISIILVYTKR